MNNITGLIALGLTAASMVAHSQVTTLDFQSSSVLTGTSSYLPLYDTTSDPNAALPTSPFSGNLSLSIQLTGSFAQKDLYVTSFQGDIGGAGLYVGPGPLSWMGTPTVCGPPGCIDFITSNGAILGATLDVFGNEYHNSYDHITIGANGDSVSYSFADTNGGCLSHLSTIGANTYANTGPAINPCSVDASNRTAGTWTVTGALAAPEIDPAFAASGLTLLFGGIAVLRGRRVLSVRSD
jgi:hypothetical protein